MMMWTLWLVLALGFTAGNLVYWLTWTAEREIRQQIQERQEARTWYREARR